MIKLCVGADTVDDLRAWQAAHAAPGEPWVVGTRQTPKRAAELLDGGSLYRVFRGQVLCRQRILAIDTLGQGQEARCRITVDPQIVLTAPMPRRAFQGWRYFEAKDAPEDLGPGVGEGPMPQNLARQLRELGVW